MTRTRNQHYVPQTYLRAWCNSDDQLWVFDKKSGKTFLSSPRNVASQRDAYDTLLTEDSSDPATFQFFERQFQEIEQLLKPTLTSIIACARQLSGPILLPGRIAASQADIDRLCEFVVVQMLRDMQFRDRLRSKSKEWLKRIWDATAPILFKDSRVDLSFESVNEDYVSL